MSNNSAAQSVAVVDDMAKWLKNYRFERPRDYVLNGKTPVAVADILEWGRWYETADRRVARSEHSSGLYVSTVFLGLDHSFFGEAPELFETMVFGVEDDLIARYATWDEAEAGHAAAIDQLVLTDGEWTHFKAVPSS